jgi:hypothetical protein
MSWVGHVARRGDWRDAYRVLLGKLKERDNLENLGLDGRILLKRIFKNWGGEPWTDLIWRALVNAVMNLQVP